MFNKFQSVMIITFEILNMLDFPRKLFSFGNATLLVL